MSLSQDHRRRLEVNEINCEQSHFFFRLSEGSARARERRSRETRETRAAARKEKRVTLFFRASPVSRLQSRAWSFTCLARFARWTKKKERLLVVSSKELMNRIVNLNLSEHFIVYYYLSSFISKNH